MSKFDQIVKGILAGGAVFGPILIHSDKGLAILNASEETAAAVIAHHQEAHQVAKGKQKKP